MDREELRKIMADQILFSREVTEILGFSRQRLMQLVKEGRIRPIRKGVYMKDEILEFKKEREKLNKEM